ncbi:MAG: hypothetical protein ABSB69_02460 [Solirubrobacteraceae bacterium]
MSPDGAQPTDDGPAHAGGQAGAPGGGAGEPSEEELRAAYEAELSRLTSTDVMAQAVVSLLNIGARRLAPAGADQDPTRPAERDLEQARDAIDAVRALLEILERRIPRELKPLRDALSRLQMAYAHEVGPGAPSAGEDAPGAGAGTQGTSADTGRQPPTDERPPGPGPAESSGRLWVPGR